MILGIRVACGCHTGNLRDNNEDITESAEQKVQMKVQYRYCSKTEEE